MGVVLVGHQDVAGAELVGEQLGVCLVGGLDPRTAGLHQVQGGLPGDQAGKGGVAGIQSGGDEAIPRRGPVLGRGHHAVLGQEVDERLVVDEAIDHFGGGRGVDGPVGRPPGDLGDEVGHAVPVEGGVAHPYGRDR